MSGDNTSALVLCRSVLVSRWLYSTWEWSLSELETVVMENTKMIIPILKMQLFMRNNQTIRDLSSLYFPILTQLFHFVLELVLSRDKPLVHARATA